MLLKAKRGPVPATGISPTESLLDGYLPFLSKEILNIYKAVLRTIKCSVSLIDMPFQKKYHSWKDHIIFTFYRKVLQIFKESAFFKSNNLFS